MSDELPQGWTTAPLGKLSQPTRPRRNPKEHPRLPFVGMEQVESHTRRLLGTLSSSEMRSTAFHFQPGDVLYGRLRPYLNKVLRADIEWLCSSEFIVLPPQSTFEPKYLAFYLSTDGFVTFANQLNQGDRPRVRFDQIADHEIPLPPLAEQRRIVAKLEKLLVQVDTCQGRLAKIPALLKRFRQAVLAAACSGRLTADWREERTADCTDDTDNETSVKFAKSVVKDWTSEDLPELPETWSWVALGDYARCFRGKFTPRPRNDPRYFGGKYPFIQIGNLPREGGLVTSHAQTLNDEGLAVSRKFPKGTVVIAIVGATIGNTGVLAYDMCVTDSIVGLETGDELGNRYVELFLRHKKDDIRQTSYSSGGQPNINLATLKPYPLALPRLPEQQEIVRRVEGLLALSDQIEARLSAAQRQVDTLTPSLLARAFVGKLVPQDPADEPAERLLERIRRDEPRIARQM